jgi:hypothetical protein
MRLFLLFACAGGLCQAQLQGIVDTHVHCDPDSAPRSIDALAAARMARDEGMRALLLKNHTLPTGPLAYAVAQAVPGVEIYGGVVLNRAAGGINPALVDQAAAFKGGQMRVVWMPTFDAGRVAISRGGKLLPEVIEVLQIMAKRNLALATGHSTAEENLLLVEAARRAGVARIMLTHPVGRMTLDQLKQAAAGGAYVELVYHSLLGPGPRAPKIADYAAAIRAVGADHCILSSDLGQADSPVHTVGWKSYLELLRKEGVTAAEIDRMARRNPARFLGLE